MEFSSVFEESLNGKADELVESAEETSRFLKMIAHPQRLIILCSLISGPKVVHELEAATGCSQSQVSQFLRLMKMEGLVDCQRDGQFIRYFLADPRFESLVIAFHKTFCGTEGIF